MNWWPRCGKRGTVGIVEGDGYLDAFFEDEAVARRFGDPQRAARSIGSSEPKMRGRRCWWANDFFWSRRGARSRRRRGESVWRSIPDCNAERASIPARGLCLEAMERTIRPGDSVLDVGSGSGILSIAAKLLGAGRVVACDIDPEAARPVPFFVGSVDAVRAGAFDVVVANINEDVIGEMRPEFERVARTRILRGFRMSGASGRVTVCSIFIMYASPCAGAVGGGLSGCSEWRHGGGPRTEQRHASGHRRSEGTTAGRSRSRLRYDNRRRRGISFENMKEGEYRPFVDKDGFFPAHSDRRSRAFIVLERTACGWIPSSHRRRLLADACWARMESPQQARLYG